MTKSAPARRARADTTALTLGSIVSGLAAYGFVVVGTRTVGPQAFAPVSVLWSLWAISAAAITFPIQHWVIRTVEVAGHESDVWATAPAIWKLAALLGTLVFAGAYAVGSRLFTVPGVSFPLMAALLPLGSVVMGLNRGLLAARSRFHATSVAILGENLLRLALALALASVASPTVLGWILIAGFSVGVIFPSTVGRGSPSPSYTFPVGLLGGMAGANAAAQVALTSGPIALSLLGGSSTSVTTLFAMLAVLRAPHTLALGITARLTGPLTRLAGEDGRSGLRRAERRIVWAAMGMALLGAALGPLVVPAVTELVFGVGSQVPAMATALLSVGTVVALAGLVQMLLLLAEGRGRRLVAAWVVALAVGSFVLVVVPVEPLTKVSGAFAASEVVALLVMLVPARLPKPWRATRRDEVMY